ncbi:MAG: SGNH/GDSL hydrolase family protein [Candidatus Omnitrophica bacterium]|nr:SGNH/GDSL hydrolase family protein [Candidatus Omnitrophota bacterium]
MKISKNIILAVSSIFLFLLIFELGTRPFIKPSPKCYGVLWGKELPPFKITFGDKFQADYDQLAVGWVVDGQQMTKGDLWGILKEDPVLGFVPVENAVSRNGWWQSNNWGARAREDISKNILPGKKRIIIFGDSFTNCSRVPQEETWPFFLNQKSDNLEFVNLGVDGYSMGQSFLRYENLRNKIDYDVAVLVFVPGLDLWRDINVLRQLDGWENYPLFSRFIVRQNKLELISRPYKTYEDLQRNNFSDCSDVLKNYLRAYDRSYFTAKYESPPFIGGLISYKLLATVICQFQKKNLFKNMMNNNSEAIIVTQKIFEKINTEANGDNKKFILVYLPTAQDIRKYATDPLFRRQYVDMVSLSEKKGIICLNLMDDFLKLPPDQFDFARDGVHYGPKSNKIISKIMWEKLNYMGAGQ